MQENEQKIYLIKKGKRIRVNNISLITEKIEFFSNKENCWKNN